MCDSSGGPTETASYPSDTVVTLCKRQFAISFAMAQKHLAIFLPLCPPLPALACVCTMHERRALARANTHAGTNAHKGKVGITHTHRTEFRFLRTGVDACTPKRLGKRRKVG